MQDTDSTLKHTDLSGVIDSGGQDNILPFDAPLFLLWIFLLST
jgi:hypothetical protein